MTNTDVIWQYVRGIRCDPTGGTAALRVVAVEGYYGPATVLQSYGVPIAVRTCGYRDALTGEKKMDDAPSFFVDVFSAWSATTTKHTAALLRTIREGEHRMHRVDYEIVNGVRETAPAPRTSDRNPPKQRVRPL